MKRTAKIVSLFLVLVLIVGAISVIASANETYVHPTLTVNGDGITTVQTDDYESYKEFWLHWSESGTKPDSISAYAKNHGHLGLKKNAANSYFSFWYERYATYGTLVDFDTDGDGTADLKGTDFNNDTKADLYRNPADGKDTTTPGPVTVYGTNAVTNKNILAYDSYSDLFSGNTPYNNTMFSGKDANGYTEFDSSKPLASGGEYLLEKDFMVFEFDFGADRYIDKDGKLTDNVNDAVSLSYSENIMINPEFRASTASAYALTTNNARLRIAYDGTEERWYAYVQGDTEKRVYLAENVGEWNHATLVLKIDDTVEYSYIPEGSETPVPVECSYKEALKDPNFSLDKITQYHLYKSRAYWYINGEYVNDSTFLKQDEKYYNTPAYYATSSTKTENNVDVTTYYYVPAAATCFTCLRLGDNSKIDQSYSIGIDNRSSRIYKGSLDSENKYTAYSGDLASFISQNSTGRITSCNDIAGHAAYNFSYPNTPLATVSYADDTPSASYYMSIDEAFAAVKEGSVLTLGIGVTDVTYMSTADSVNFKVACQNRSDFAVAGDFNVGRWIESAEFTGYEVVDIDESTEIGVKYYPTYDDAIAKTNEIPAELGVDNTVFANGYISVLKEYNKKGILGSPAEDGFELDKITGWIAVYVDEENVPHTFSTAETVSESAVSAIKAYNDGAVSVYPVYTTYYLTHTVTDGSGNVLTLNGNYDYLLVGNEDNFAADLNSVLAANKTASGIKVTLYKDIETNTAKLISVGGSNNTSLQFDVNGFRFLYCAYGTTATLFSIRDDASLFVYSSRAGGEIIVTAYESDGARGYFSSMGAQRATLQLGKYGDISGDNLSVYCALLTDSTKSSTAQDTVANQNKIIIDGGFYARVVKGMSALILIRSNTHIDIKNARIITTNGYLLQTAPTTVTYNKDGTIKADYRHSVLTMDIDNSEIYAYTGFINNSLYEGTAERCSYVNITNSAILTSFKNAKKLSATDTSYILLGHGTKTYAQLDENGDAVIFPEGYKNLTYNGKYAIDMPYYAITFDSATQINRESITTKADHKKSYGIYIYVSVPTAENSATVNFFDSDGSTLVSGALHAPDAVLEAPAVVGKELDNPFFDLAFSAWVDAEGKAVDFTKLEIGKSYNVYAKLAPVEDVDLNQVMMNIVASTKFQPRIYVPVPDANGYDGYIVTITKNTSYVVKYQNTDYYCTTLGAYPTPTTTGGSANYSIEFKVTKASDENDVTSLTKSLTTKTLPAYFNKAMETADDVGKKLVIAIVNFCNESIKATSKDGSGYSLYEDLLDKYSSHITAISNYKTDIENQAKDESTAQLATYVDAGYIIGSGALPFFIIRPNSTVAINPEDAVASITEENPTVKYFLYSPGKSSYCYFSYDDFGTTNTVRICENAIPYNYAGISFGATNNASAGSGSTGENALEYLFSYNTNLPAYAWYKNVDITLTVLPTSAVKITDGEATSIDISDRITVKGTYNIACYINDLRAIEKPTANETKALAVMEALYVYSRAAENYVATPEVN